MSFRKYYLILDEDLSVFDHIDRDLCDLRVKLRSFIVLKFGDYEILGQVITVASVGIHCIERIRNSDDTRHKRYVLAGQAFHNAHDDRVLRP